MEILSSTINPFKGIVVSPDKLPKDPECFIKSLDRSIKSWGDDEYLVVWLQVPLCKASLIPRAIDAGFQFHHAGDDYLMLTLQLSDGAYIPPFASHYAGAGGVVINDLGELLVVCERHRPNNRLPYYKLPGGTLKSGEDLVDAVVREVLEETGINTRFESLICM
ncbi:NUDIX domain-containing protein, partial [SAR202 cluster bacterium AD-804-J14_MRT_500m]|nr:NUDIX domain-containing protein [SAR202 cluster bacterium AD-804-J14_MRT_500m]MQF69957.1 NUDIX domain-containing protein [SAR202 cluster bacterium AD-804-J14_MRT_500m]